MCIFDITERDNEPNNKILMKTGIEIEIKNEIEQKV